MKYTYIILIGKSERSKDFENKGVEWLIILKWTAKMGYNMGTGFIWHRIRSSGGFFCTL